MYPGGTWFDGYDGHDCVLFDDFTGDIKFCYFLQVIDRYLPRVPVKGGFTPWTPKRIYITSNIAPNLWYPDTTPYQKEALLRRIHQTVMFQ